jgi:hypothetical protein
MTQMSRPRVAFAGGVLICRAYEISAAKIGVRFWLGPRHLVGLDCPVCVGVDERLPSAAAGTRDSTNRQHGHDSGHAAVQGRGTLGDWRASYVSTNTHWRSRRRFW